MTPLIPNRLNLETGVAGWGMQDKTNIAGTRFWGKARIGSVPLYLAWYPFGNGFNLDAGIYFNDNRLSVYCAAPVGGAVRIARHVYTAAELGYVTGATRFNLVAPFLGLGYGQPFSTGRWSFSAALGVFYEGSADLKLTASNPSALLLPGVAARVRHDQSEINHYASMVDFYPVVSIGVVYRF